jgi:hypothetical protein
MRATPTGAAPLPRPHKQSNTTGRPVRPEVMR